MKDTTLTQFLNDVARGSATPGGGSASALAGSLASALVEMVVNLTIGRKGFQSLEARLKEIGEEARSYREALVSTMSRDMDAYQEVMNAYLLPKTTEDQKRERREQVQRAIKKAADPPVFTAVTSLKVLHLCREVLEKGNPSATGDAAVGALLSHAALLAGILNARVNLGALDDPPYVERVKRELQRLEEEGDRTKEEILARVREKW